MPLLRALAIKKMDNKYKILALVIVLVALVNEPALTVVAPYVVGAWLVYQLWKLVIAAIRNPAGESGEAIAKILGAFEVSITDETNEKKRIRKLSGAGLLGTMVILVLAIICSALIADIVRTRSILDMAPGVIDSVPGIMGF